MADIVDIYMECGDFHQAVRMSGLPIHIAHLKLLKSGCLKIQDKIAFGSKGAKLGGQAEELFQKLVPNAIDANKYFQKNNPVYDFCVKNLTVDVKYSSLRKSPSGNDESSYWDFRPKGDQDFICAFLESDKGKELAEPFVLLIPMAFVDSKAEKLHISRNGAFFREFRVEPEELQPLLNDYAELKEEGLL